MEKTILKNRKCRLKLFALPFFFVGFSQPFFSVMWTFLGLHSVCPFCYTFYKLRAAYTQKLCNKSFQCQVPNSFVTVLIYSCLFGSEPHCTMGLTFRDRCVYQCSLRLVYVLGDIGSDSSVLFSYLAVVLFCCFFSSTKYQTEHKTQTCIFCI